VGMKKTQNQKLIEQDGTFVYFNNNEPSKFTLNISPRGYLSDIKLGQIKDANNAIICLQDNI
jgi:hypothetical protein